MSSQIAKAASAAGLHDHCPPNGPCGCGTRASGPDWTLRASTILCRQATPSPSPRFVAFSGADPHSDLPSGNRPDEASCDDRSAAAYAPLPADIFSSTVQLGARREIREVVESPISPPRTSRLAILVTDSLRRSIGAGSVFPPEGCIPREVAVFASIVPVFPTDARLRGAFGAT